MSEVGQKSVPKQEFLKDFKDDSNAPKLLEKKNKKHKNKTKQEKDRNDTVLVRTSSTLKYSSTYKSLKANV